MSKIVVLNSGGFDSIVLANTVRDLYQEDEIHNLFFNYGQLNLESERRHSIKCAEKLGLVFKEVTLPQFDWSNSVLSGGSNESQYIPLRNLILLSYALSYAEAIGASEVFCAFINPEGEYYRDTSPMFLDKLNDLSSLFTIQVQAPFIESFKGGLLKSLARQYGVYRSDVHSCNYGNEPCGVCEDCKALDEIFEDIENKIADDIFIDNCFEVTDDFVQSVKDSKVSTAKLYINNACQFSCSHCFIGKHKLYGEPLSINEWCGVIAELADNGIDNIDFFGKEPLIDAKVFTLMDTCRTLGVKYGLITNGVNVENYIDLLEFYKPKIALSVENLTNVTEYRDTGNHLRKTIKLLVSKDIPVSVSIDLTASNAKHLNDMIKCLYDIGVREFYIKPIRPFGESEHFLMDEIISPKQMFKCMKKLQKLNKKLKTHIMVSLAMMDADRFNAYDAEEFYNYFGDAITNRRDYVNGILVDVELYCHRFKEIIAITPEGYVLGCASEYCTDYSHYMNVREHTIKECIMKGKESLNKECYNDTGCYFCKEYKKEGKIFQ